MRRHSEMFRRCCALLLLVSALGVGRVTAVFGADVQAKLDAVNQREKHLTEKLEALRERERHVEKQLEAVRQRKQVLLDKQARGISVKPTATPEQTPAP